MGAGTARRGGKTGAGGERGDRQRGRGRQGEVYHLRRRSASTGAIDSNFRGRVSHDNHGRRVPQGVRTTLRAVPVRRSGGADDGDVAGPDGGLVSAIDVGDRRGHDPGGDSEAERPLSRNTGKGERQSGGRGDTGGVEDGEADAGGPKRGSILSVSGGVRGISGEAG